MSTKSGDQQIATQNSSMAAKIRSLEILKETISRHQVHLETLCAERDQLERELEAFQLKKPIIHRLPPEILTDIFTKVIQARDYRAESLPVANYGRIALASVCKAWKSIVDNTPTLWRIIHMNMPYWTQDFFQWVRKMDSYLDQCLGKSGDTGLHVLMNLNCAIGGANYALFQANKIVQRTSSGDFIAEWPNEVDWEQFPIAKAYDRKLKGLIRRIMGKDGGKMKNWERWNLSMPQDEDAFRRIWPLFNNPASQLQIFDLSSMDFTSNGPSLSLDRLSFPILRTAEVSGASLQVVASCPHLRELSVVVYLPKENWDDLLLLTTYPLLEELKIGVIDWDPEMDDYDHLNVPTVHIPFLEHLKLVGRLPERVIRALDIDRISRLTIDAKLYASEGYPEAPSARLFTGAQYVNLVFTPYQDSPLKTLLRSLLPQLSSSHTIEVPEDLFDVALQMVEYEKGRGNLGSLHRLVAHEEDGEVTERIYPID